MSNPPYTYQPAGNYSNSDFQGGQYQPSFTYPQMPEGYQQYAAVPPPAPGAPGYFSGPQYYQQQYFSNLINPPLAAPHQAHIPVAQQEVDQQKFEQHLTAENPPQPQPEVPSVFDNDPTAIKRTTYFTPDCGSGSGYGASMNSPAQPPVVGYLVTLPFIPNHPTLGIPTDTACCYHCRQQQYTGRTVNLRGKLSIVAPTASMSGQDGLNAPIHSIDGELFRPCLCPNFIHRGCFREMRAGMTVLKSRAYYECPKCSFTYKLERIMGGAKTDPRAKSFGNEAPKPATMGEGTNDHLISNLESLDESAIKNYYYRRIALMWLAAFLTCAAVVAILAGISYAIDKEDKNIPVFIKMMLSSVAFKYPSSATREEWRVEFRDPDVKVVQYYTAFAVFLTAVGILIFGMISYLCCIDTNDSEIRPSLCGYICGNDGDREAEISRYIENRKQNQNPYTCNLPPPVQAAVVQREQRRSNELRDHYFRQNKPSYWFSCTDNSSYYYYDSRPYYYRRRPNYYDNRNNGNGRHYYSGGYYYGSNEACCDLCYCCILCCDCCSAASAPPPSHHYQHDGNRYNTTTGTGHSNCDCGNCDCGNCDCDCGNCDCNCNGDCGKCDGEGAIVILLIALLVIVIVVIVSAYVTMMCYLISRTIRLMGVAGKLAYIQALEREDHVFALAINESWRPVGAV